jgi:hypothetical protein
MKSKRQKKRTANQARSAAHQRAVLELRRSSAASSHTNTVPRSETNRRALQEEKNHD